MHAVLHSESLGLPPQLLVQSATGAVCPEAGCPERHAATIEVKAAYIILRDVKFFVIRSSWENSTDSARFRMVNNLDRNQLLLNYHNLP